MTTFGGFPQDGYEFDAGEVGAALAGFVARSASGVPRTGVLGIAPLVFAEASAWFVRVRPFAYVDQEFGAIIVSGVLEDEVLPITTAASIPAGQARIDVVTWEPGTAVLDVVEGAVAASPVAPNVPAGVEPLAHVLVAAGDGSVNAAGITAVYRSSALVGTELPVRKLADLTGWTPGVGQQVRDLSRGVTLRWNGSSWDGEWIPLTLLNQFTNGADASPAAYRIMNDRLEFRGALRRAAAPRNWTRAFVLPAAVAARLERFALSVYIGTSSQAGAIAYRPNVAGGGIDIYSPAALAAASDLAFPLSLISVALKEPA